VKAARADGKPLVDAGAGAARMMPALLEEGVRQVVSIPLTAQGRLVGAILLGARHARTFAPEQLSLLASIGQQVGVAVENARLYEAERARHAEAERRREVAEGMREIVAVLNSGQSLPETLQFIVSILPGAEQRQFGLLRFEEAGGRSRSRLPAVSMPTMSPI
jgi:GAF domain-containing protein